MGRKIVLTSGKGGVGKTTICANLGIQLSQMGNRVVMLDVDIGLNNLDVVMGVENKVVYDIADCIEGKCRIKQALIRDPFCPTLFILPSSHIFTNTKINSYNLKEIVDTLNESFDYVLIDCPAGIDMGFHRAVFSASEALVVTTPHISSLRDADKVINILSSYNLSNVGFIINRMRGDLVLNGEMIDPSKICELLNANLIGVIPEDDLIGSTTGVNSKNDKTIKYEAFKTLANNIHYGNNSIYDATQKYKGFFGALKRNLRKKV